MASRGIADTTVVLIAIVGVAALIVVLFVLPMLAYQQVATVWRDLTRLNIESTSAACTADGVVINVRNSGSDPVRLSGPDSDITVTKVVVYGDVPSAMRLSFKPAILQPGAGGSITDALCNGQDHSGSTCQYTILAGGRSSEQQVTC